jgi:UDP-2-acetamido-3-amino-2,3-dideoxy-glucuronate N-acetyltransferase
MTYFKHESACVDEPCDIGEGTKIWHFCHVMRNARIGRGCILGQNVFIANEVVLGNNVKIQNNVSVYTGTVVEDDVFLGPSCVLTNVTNPRSQVIRHDLYERTLLRRGCDGRRQRHGGLPRTVRRYAFRPLAPCQDAGLRLMVGVPAGSGLMSRRGTCRRGRSRRDGCRRAGCATGAEPGCRCLT